MIKRLTNPEEFNQCISDLADLFEVENSEQGHYFLKHDKGHITNAFSHSQILAWDFFVWGNLNKHGIYDAMIAFLNNKNEKFGESIFSEYLWLSKNPKVGYKLLATALAFARKKEFKYVAMSAAYNNPSFDKVTSFYKKMGFLKDSETYIAKLYE
jgi:hypothetical protein|tara:strand:+ start:6404 stop:6868 length:465 start_codon:yes stop_codon:yes gene_type:complete